MKLSSMREPQLVRTPGAENILVRQRNARQRPGLASGAAIGAARAASAPARSRGDETVHRLSSRSMRESTCAGQLLTGSTRRRPVPRLVMQKFRCNTRFVHAYCPRSFNHPWHQIDAVFHRRRNGLELIPLIALGDLVVAQALGHVQRDAPSASRTGRIHRLQLLDQIEMRTDPRTAVIGDPLFIHASRARWATA
jgi:hypothetical protein